jgi:hypothetical protein
MTMVGSGYAKASIRSASPRADHGVEQRVGDRLDARPQVRHALGRERLAHQVAQSAVVGAVGVEHVLVEPAIERRDAAGIRSGGSANAASRTKRRSRSIASTSA